MEQNTISFTEESVRSHFILLAVFWWIGFPLSILGNFVKPFEIIALPFLILTTVFWCILLYRHWYTLQGLGARITPGKAVGFGFIPFYCFYWWFVSYAGLATDTNRYLNSIGVRTPRMSFELAVTDCIISILISTIGLIPDIGVIMILPYMIIGFILAWQQRDCVLAIMHSRKEKTNLA